MIGSCVYTRTFLLKQLPKFVYYLLSTSSINKDFPVVPDVFCQNTQERLVCCVVLGLWQCKSLFTISGNLQMLKISKDLALTEQLSHSNTLFNRGQFFQSWYKESATNLKWELALHAAGRRRTKGTSTAWGIPRFLSSNMAAMMGTLNEVFPGVGMSIVDVATGLIRMRKHWFPAKVQNSFHPDEKSFRICQ